MQSEDQIAAQWLSFQFSSFICTDRERQIMQLFTINVLPSLRARSLIPHSQHHNSTDDGQHQVVDLVCACLEQRHYDQRDNYFDPLCPTAANINVGDVCNCQCSSDSAKCALYSFASPGPFGPPVSFATHCR